MVFLGGLWSGSLGLLSRSLRLDGPRQDGDLVFWEKTCCPPCRIQTERRVQLEQLDPR